MRPLVGPLILLAALEGPAAVQAHPSSLECGTDATTRLRYGATIMGRKVGMSGLLDGVIVGNTCWGGVMQYMSVTAPNGTFLAVRVMGPGEIAPASLENQTALKFTCPKQVYTQTAPGGRYARMTLINATNETSVVVGAWNGKPRPFGEKVHLTLNTCDE